MMKMAFGRTTPNEVKCRKFRELLTKGFYVVGPDGVIYEFGSQAPIYELGIGITKDWRNEIWKAFQEIEDDLCPVKKFEEGRGL